MRPVRMGSGGGDVVTRACGPKQVDDVVALLEAVWSAPPGSGPLTAPVLHALVQTGAVVRICATDAGDVRAALVAFRSTTDPFVLHLHVVGVHESARGTGLGRRMLVDLRHEAVGRGFKAIEWTFDPLVRRNAHLYLRVLGARVVSYLRDPYGELDDGINAGHGSDRLLVRWPLSAGPAPAGPAPTDRVPVPEDIERLRRRDPAAARAWRLRTRDRLSAPGTAITGFDEDGCYLVTPARVGQS